MPRNYLRYKFMSKKVYLDYAAATPLDPQALKAMMPFLTTKFHNPSAIYLDAKHVKEELNEARSQLARLMGARPIEIIFTSGATEANNLAIQGVMRAHAKGEVLVSAIEHESVIAPSELFRSRQIAVDKTGLVNLTELEKQISKDTVLISVMFVNNEIGCVQPIAEIAQLVTKVRRQRQKSGNQTPLYLHSDLAQAGNYYNLNMARLGLDMATINGGKIYGPKQSGVLYIKAGVRLEPLIMGGGQEFGFRSGTENVAGCVGLATAFSFAQGHRTVEAEKTTKLRQFLEACLGKNFKDVIINGSTKHKAPHIVSATLAGIDNERVMMELDEIGVQVAVGSACSASSGEPSHVLSAIGLTEVEARATLRFSLGRYTTQKDVKKLVNGLIKITKS